jgi:hypothetical protein
MPGRKTMILTTILLLFVVQLQAQKSRQMANYIYSFIKYVEWPKEYLEGNFVIGIYGDVESASDLEKLITGRKINSQPVILKKFTHPDEISRCHMIVISARNDKAIESIIEKIKPYNTLIITEKPGLTKKGPGICLTLKSGRLSFELNKANIIKKGLNIDHQLNLMASVTY